MKRPSLPSARLAAGRLPFWRQTQPSLAIDVAAPSEEEKATPTTSRWIAAAARGIALTLVGLLAFSAAAWVILGITVRPTPRVAGDMWAVQWAAWPEEAVPVGALIAVTEDPVERGILARLGYQFGGGNVTIQKVLDGPGGIVSTDDALNVLYGGVPTGAVASAPISEQSLGDAYLTVCLAGCGDGNGFVSKAPVDSVMGEALGRFQPPFSYTPITDGAADAR